MPSPRYSLTKKRLKRLPPALMIDVESEIKAILHAGRDCYRNQGRDTIRMPWDVGNGYYGEAFGIMRALHIQGYGYFGSHNLSAIAESPRKIHSITQDQQNLNWWFSELCREVLEEEGFDGDHRCEYCLEKYKKDDAYILEKKAQHDDQKAGECGDTRPRSDA